jgi:hypothetical protein
VQKTGKLPTAGLGFSVAPCEFLCRLRDRRFVIHGPLLLAALAITLAVPTSARAGDWSSRGELALEGRQFDDDDLELTPDRGLALFGRLELEHSHGRLQEKTRFYGRLDRYDQRRSVLAFEEAWAQLGLERLRLRAGVDLINWTATEAFHPADVINARNLDSDLENFEKVGEPMVALQLRLFSGTTVQLLFMPHRTAPIFASPASRLSFAPGIDLKGSRRMIDRDGDLTDARWGPQAAFALRQVLGNADLTLHALEHLDRSQPLVRVDPLTFSPLLVFQTVRQLGGTYQHALGPVVLKLEGAYRRFVAPREPPPGIALGPLATAAAGQPDHGQLAAGLEYGVSHEGGSESTFLLEGQAVLGVDDPALRATLSIFQRDVLIGYRFALNDEAGKELMVGAIFDTERSGESLVMLNYQQRLGETWTVRGGLRLFHAKASAPGPMAVLRTSDHIRLALTRHF